MKEILLSEKEMVFLVLLYFHVSIFGVTLAQSYDTGSRNEFALLFKRSLFLYFTKVLTQNQLDFRNCH